MKKILHLFIIAIISNTSITYATELNVLKNTNNTYLVGKKKIKLTCSQSDAEIYVNDKLMGKGSFEIKVPDEGCTTVEVIKEGYITAKEEFCNKKGLSKLPSKYHFSLKKDDAFDATVHSDIVNVDFKITALKGKDESWKKINQIILNQFDAIEIADKETGYLRTSWVVKRFKYSAVRTRFIVKEFSSNPLVYKVKLASEHSQNAMAGANQGEHFKEWGRVLRKYSNIESEIQARVK
ncbi:MAG: hypothetical protein L3J34_04535 [Flavobacteriaceae bacterium]|nr:hypothetical protein [Flavobacteriaceae bacterium]